MATETGSDQIDGNDSKMWVVWVFLLGGLAGFLVSFIFADKIKELTGKKEVVSTPTVEPPVAPVHVEESSKPVVVEEIKHESENEVVMTHEMRNRLLTFDFLKLLQDADIRRYRYEGETRGIVLNKIRTGSVYEKIGFKNGDIIESINGIALADVDKRKKEMADKLPGAESLIFKIRRNEKTQTLKVKVADPRE